MGPNVAREDLGPAVEEPDELVRVEGVPPLAHVALQLEADRVPEEEGEGIRNAAVALADHLGSQFQGLPQVRTLLQGLPRRGGPLQRGVDGVGGDRANVKGDKLGRVPLPEVPEPAQEFRSLAEAPHGPGSRGQGRHTVRQPSQPAERLATLSPPALDRCHPIRDPPRSLPLLPDLVVQLLKLGLREVDH